MKKILSFLAILSLIFTIAGCSATKENKESAVEKSNSKLTDQVKSKMYNAARVAEGKVNDVFHHDVAADGTTPVLNASFSDENAAVGFLSKYYSEDVAKEIYNYYVTGEKTAEGQIIVKPEPFFTSSLLETTIENVKIEGDANKSTISTSENVKYTIEQQDDKYIVTDIKK